MPDLLLELFSEEIPARMQAQACEDLKRLAAAALAERDLAFEGIAAFATPRRLSLHVAGLPNRQPDRREEKKGPRVGAPEAAVQGFLKSAGLASLAEAQIERDPKKGEFYVAIVERAGGATLDVLAEVLPGLIRGFPWPKSMRWGAGSARSDALRWVRPLHSILATFGPETEEPEIVPFAVGPIAAGNMTRGHRFLAPGTIKVRRFDDYVTSLDKAKVVLDPARRRDIILYDARTLAMAHGLDLVEDDALLHEVAGLVEWPVVLMGTFDAAFLDIPPEVIRATIRANQKCFVLRETARERLGNKFILVSNIAASDGGTAIAAGNARVVRARLSDAKFFWDTDRKIRLEARLPKLETIVFHEKLGTQGARVRRLVALAQTLAPRVGADAKLAARAAELAKPDLVSEMVGEFPELQGLMGRYYAQAQGEDAAVAAAIEEHYKPQGPGDRVPDAPVSIAVALADKLDVLTGFWAIDEKPTGSKDPFALRRAALGVLRLVLDNGLRLPLSQLIEQALAGHATGNAAMAAFVADGAFTTQGRVLCDQLLAFFADRLKVHLREQGARYDLIDAVFALAGQDDILLIVRRVEALGRFLATEEGKNLFAGTRRAANILRAEEKKDGAGAFAAPCDPALFGPDEAALWQQLTRVETEATQHLARAAEADDDSSGRPFEDAMECLSSLRTRVDAFFEAVTVNADDPALRLNRLRLLNSLRAAVHEVADFSKIAG